MTISADHSAPDQAQRLPAEDAVTEAVRKFGITAISKHHTGAVLVGTTIAVAGM